MNSRRLFLTTIWHSVLLMLVAAVAAHADADCTIKNARVRNEGETALNILFAYPVNLPNENNTAGWTLFDLTSNEQISILKVIPDQSPPPASSATVGVSRAILRSHSYLLSATKLDFVGCTPDQIPTVQVDTAKPKSGGIFDVGTAQDRSSSDLYLSGMINGAKHEHASYTADVKFQVPIILKSASFGTGTSYRPEISFLPLFDFTGSTDKDSDGDSVLFGAGFRFVNPLVGSARNAVLTGIVARPIGALESDKHFHDINALFRLEAPFVVRPLLSSTYLNVYAQPIVGLDAGANVRAPISGVYSQSILRPVTGGHVYVKLFNSEKRRVSIESEYTRRWLTHPEPEFSENDDGSLNLLGTNTRARDYVTTKFQWDFNDYVGLTFSHDNGKLPPTFVRVNNKYTIGLTLKMGLTYQP
jgi:hypothetical protein